MAHPKRVINFALFFMPFSNSATNSCGISSTRTNQDNTGQIWTALAARPNIAYLVATFERDYSRNH